MLINKTLIKYIFLEDSKKKKKEKVLRGVNGDDLLSSVLIAIVDYHEIF